MLSKGVEIRRLCHYTSWGRRSVLEAAYSSFHAIGTVLASPAVKEWISSGAPIQCHTTLIITARAALPHLIPHKALQNNHLGSFYIGPESEEHSPSVKPKTPSQVPC